MELLLHLSSKTAVMELEDKITYANDLDQIISLVSISESCEQVIINNCTNNILSHMSWWTDRNGNKLEYWDGNHPIGTEGCKCSLEGSGCDINQKVPIR